MATGVVVPSVLDGAPGAAGGPGGVWPLVEPGAVLASSSE